ncbi:hypothetical protein AMAG_02696 [Allomyces macrogynus ATCC 38327]|uniref:GPI-anchored wall transfer protein n=1 Tax=Allomyces macrogynus (strain ATCC 38327) TaxID=578462 RepID=A0A0L0S3G3_ALLM3|nr:hypothetical protein AMAG_02696 [Allomyces macrogynus ATCC 38327]|eukprot:KNE56929.1 hypothetical protein AMAG_02696 [Allomyces macrogynus ATCC 38327]
MEEQLAAVLSDADQLQAAPLAPGSPPFAAMGSGTMSEQEIRRREKEQFVSGLTGTSMEEVHRVMLVAVFSYLALKLTIHQFGHGSSYLVRVPRPIRWLLEFAFLFAVPNAAVLWPDVLAHRATLCAAFGLLVAVTFPRPGSLARMPPSPAQMKEWARQLNDRIKPAVTVYRALMMSLTCFAILAVDFHVFPRRFAKTEVFGTSLMDLGVGCFVFSQGLTVGLKQGSTAASPPSVWSSIRRGWPLWLLGLGRVISVKGLDYQEHVSEYGVHWNFFFTLAALGPIVVFLDRWVRWSDAPMAAMLLIDYEVLLAKGLQHYVLTAPRTNLISANREGLASLFGYVAIFLAARHVGRTLASPLPTVSAWRRLLWRTLAPQIALTAAALWVASTAFHTDVSRRLCNAPFVLWTVVVNAGMVALLVLVDAVVFTDSATAAAEVADAVNANGLVVFLGANLATGTVNMVMDTLRVPDATAVAVLVAYMGSVVLVALGMSRMRWIVKF